MSMVNLLVQNSKTYLDDPTLAVNEALYKGMVCKAPGYFFTMAYKMGQWDGNVKFYDKKRKCFDTGLLSWAVQLIEQINGSVAKITDTRLVPKCDKIVSKVLLRPYQQEMNTMCKKCTRGIIRAATGSGKTEVIISLIADLGVPTIVLVDNKDLLEQTVQRMLVGLPNVAIREVHSGKEWISGSGEPLVTVSTFQTLHRKRHLIDKYKYGMKISDECHGVAADTWYEVMNYIDAYYSFGFSGSVEAEFDDPVRWNKIVSMTGKPIVTVPSSMLVDMGYLAKPNITMVTYDGGSSCGTFADEYFMAVTSNNYLNSNLLPKLVKKHAGQKTMVIVDMIEHGKALADELTAEFVHGGDDMSRRKEMLEKFKSGKIKLLIASKIFRQGIDVPDLDVLISAGSSLSYKAVFQKLGRGMRKAEGKTELTFYDIWPKTGGFLDKHAGKRFKQYQWLGFQPIITDGDTL